MKDFFTIAKNHDYYDERNIFSGKEVDCNENSSWNIGLEH